MPQALFTDDEIATVAREIVARHGADALSREAVRAELTRLAQAHGVERYRGDTTRIWRVTQEVKREFDQPAAATQPQDGDRLTLPLSPPLQRLIDTIPAAVRRELAAVQEATAQRAQLAVEAAHQAMEHRERELSGRIANLEADVESFCRTSDAADAALDAAEEDTRLLEQRLERCEGERRQRHGDHAAQLTQAHAAAQRAHEARESAEQETRNSLAALRQLQGRSDAEREARERAETTATELRDRAASAFAALERARDERDVLLAECGTLRRAVAPSQSSVSTDQPNGAAAKPPVGGSGSARRRRGAFTAPTV